jgi:GNAT superfamily N-acetyltransferase
MAKVSGVTFRAARTSDMRPAAGVFVRAVNDLTRRLGERVAPRRPKIIAARLDHLRRSSPGGFHVAVKGGRVVAFASTILREDIHFLAMFWANPALQDKGVGQQLLARAFNTPDEPPGTIRCVYASLDRRAQRLYMKFGMAPRSLVYGLAVPGKDLHLPPPPERPVELVQIGKPGEVSKQALAVAAAVDRRVRGCRRDPDQKFIIKFQHARFFEAREDGAPVGYIVVDKDGGVGPGGVIDPRYNEGLTWSGLAVAHDQRPKRVNMQLIGLNMGGLHTAFGAGLKITFMGAWMTQREFGKLGCYFATYGDIF